MNNTYKKNDGGIEQVVGDSPEEISQFPFHLHFDGRFRDWLAKESLSLALSTYEGAKLILIGPGISGKTIVSERNFERCMSMFVEGARNIWISTHHNIWKLENGLDDGCFLDSWDRVYLPREALVTGGVDVHDIVRAKDGELYGVVTGYNCIARLNSNEKGSFTPYWKPPFITEMVGQDRCHLNGFCTDEEGTLRYASYVGRSNENGKWREHKNDGGEIIDLRTNKVICAGISMPHTPRIYNKKLWFLEAGAGYLCHTSLSAKNKGFERVMWRPGFLRGLRFYKNYALICSSAPRDKTFQGLPLDKNLEEQGEEARCALDVIDMNTMSVVFSLQITGSVKEIYDVALLPNCRQPLLHGIVGEEMRKIVVLGVDETTQGQLNSRKKTA